MSPSINARWWEVESSLDFVAFRAVPTTLYPRARNARTIPAPMPCDAPVTITVLDGLFIVTLIENFFESRSVGSRRSRNWFLASCFYFRNMKAAHCSPAQHASTARRADHLVI